MAIKVVRLGSPRCPDEGLRIGTVRRPPRGVPKERYGADNWYDIWFPNLAPSPDLLAAARAATSESDWKAFKRAYRREMSASGPSRDLELLAALSQTVNFSVGCYCENEDCCHRSVLRELLAECGAKFA